ncbi:hypothetical protein BH23BAC1_BH23BAC1_11860 [soil metagenome]
MNKINQLASLIKHINSYKILKNKNKELLPVSTYKNTFLLRLKKEI